MQLQTYIARAVIGKNYVTILSGDPNEDKRMIPRGENVSFEICDARSLADGTAHVSSSLRAILKQQKKNYKSSASKGWTLIGTWEHLLYEDFDSVLNWERVLNADGPTETLCCFRNEGFCSLPLSQLVALFKLHNKAIFPATIPDSAFPLAALA
jgi:hypothetical protein